MAEHLKGMAIAQLCRKVEQEVCNSIDCNGIGRTCEAAGCDSRVCTTHEHCCPSCELRYCADCFGPHLDACAGPLSDMHDQRIEQALASDEMNCALACNQAMFSSEGERDAQASTVRRLHALAAEAGGSQ